NELGFVHAFAKVRKDEVRLVGWLLDSSHDSPKTHHRGTESTERGKSSEDTAKDTVTQLRHVEVDDEADAHPGEAQIGEELRFMYLDEPLHRFQFHNDGVFNNQINSISAVESPTFVHNWQLHLTAVMNSSAVEFITEARF